MGRQEGESDSPAGWGPRSIAVRLRSLGRTLLHDPITRRRAGIIVAALLVCAYALAVLGYVLATPEIGVRCAFTPVVNHFYTGFLYPEKQEPLQEGDLIVQVADQPVENWPQLLRKMLRLRDEKPRSIDGLSARDVLAGKVPEDCPFLLLDGRRLVRVVYERPGESERRTVWCELGQSPIESLVPSILWLFLKAGLFVVGAMVFWKRPDDRSAARFF
jgi:hypothetical protein